MPGGGAGFMPGGGAGFMPGGGAGFMPGGMAMPEDAMAMRGTFSEPADRPIGAYLGADAC